MPLRYERRVRHVTPRVNATACAALFKEIPALDPQLLDWLLLEDSIQNVLNSREKR